MNTTINKWEQVKLGTVAKVISGFAFKSKDFCTEGIPVIKIKNIRNGYVDADNAQCVDVKFSNLDYKYHVRRDDLLISLTGSHLTQPDSVVGRVALHRITGETCLLNQRAGKIIPLDSKKIDKKFLFYRLSDMKTRRNIALMAHGAASQANVSPTNVESLEINIPSLKLQQKIAAILSAYDDLIDNNNRCIKILEEMAQTIYNEWFVKFRFPGHSKVKMVDSELGKIPQGWEVKDIGDILTLEYGKGLTKKMRKPGSVPVYGSSGIIGYHNEYRVSGPAIVVGRAGNAGQIHWAHENFFPVDSTFYVSLKGDISLYFIYYFLRYSQLEKLVSGAAVPGINRNAVYKKKIIVFPEGINKRFQFIIEPIFQQKYVLEKKNKVLQQTRDLLLPKLISGKIDVEDLDIDRRDAE